MFSPDSYCYQLFEMMKNNQPQQTNSDINDGLMLLFTKIVFVADIDDHTPDVGVCDYQTAVVSEPADPAQYVERT